MLIVAYLALLHMKKKLLGGVYCLYYAAGISIPFKTWPNP